MAFKFLNKYLLYFAFRFFKCLNLDGTAQKYYDALKVMGVPARLLK